MNDLFQRVQELVRTGKLRISDHAYDEMIEDGLLAEEVLAGLPDAIVVEDYPDYPKGPCILQFQRDARGMPLHVLWGIPRGVTEPAVLITVYRPDPKKWEPAFLRRL